MGISIKMLLLVLLFLVAGYGIWSWYKSRSAGKVPTRDSARKEPSEIRLSADTADYLVAWLTCRNGLRRDFAERFGPIRQRQGNPAQFIDDCMDGVFREDYVEPGVWREFFHCYCIGLYDPQGGDEISQYRKDYEYLVPECKGWPQSKERRGDFNWERYRRFETVLNRRFEIFCRSTARNRLTYVGKQYFHTFQQEMDIETECVEDGERQAFDAYVRRCLEQVDAIPQSLLTEICEALNSWVDEEEGERITPENFHESFCGSAGAGSVEIPKPYGEELAYLLCFESDLDEEHGVSVAIKDGHVQEFGGREDADSPWVVPPSWDCLGPSAEELLTEGKKEEMKDEDK